MSDYQILTRSTYTIGKSLAWGVVAAAVITLVFGTGVDFGDEIMSRTEPSLIYLFVAVVAGMAASYALAKPEWDESLPGIAISVALIPPLSVVGIGFARFDMEVISGSLVMLLINVVGIVLASLVTFLLMNLSEQRHIARSTIKRESEKILVEQQAIKDVEEQAKEGRENNNLSA
jgi:uncharacterized hydrophobic protein (TIGR00271 family)